MYLRISLNKNYRSDILETFSMALSGFCCPLEVLRERKNTSEYFPRDVRNYSFEALEKRVSVATHPSNLSYLSVLHKCISELCLPEAVKQITVRSKSLLRKRPFCR